MTIKELFSQYQDDKIDKKKRLILCDWISQSGIEISNEKHFDEFLKSKYEYFILNRQESDKFLIYDYFTLRKVEPYVVVLQHPLMTNAYWKDIPDKIFDIFVQDGIYRYIRITYGNGVTDFVIEYPSDIDDKIFKKTQKLFPDLVLENSENNISLVFTNGNRFTELDKNNFLIYNLQEIYPDLKTKFTPLTLSRKIWSDLKATVKIK
jgi:hypothetical protein